jgi:cyclophilin family peptidyl-prolyl cis-trans isomerase
MKKFKKAGGVISILLVSSILFSGCTSQSSSDDYQLDLTAIEPVETNVKPVETERETNTNPQEKGSSMKTLADFPEIEAQQATLVTNKGELVIKLYRQQAPLTTANFLSLAQEGFYDGVVFHRVIDDFMAQVGDPKSKDPSLQAQWGTGGPSYVIADEFDPELKHDKKGIVSMANSGPNTGGSQFFITHQATPWLDNKHAVFGEVISGLEVLDQIEVGDKILEIKLD